MSKAIERLQNFVENLIINNHNGKFNCYFDFRDKQYYGEIFYNSNWDAVVQIFPAIDDIVSSSRPLRKNVIDIDVDAEILRGEIYEYLRVAFKIR